MKVVGYCFFYIVFIAVVGWGWFIFSDGFEFQRAMVNMSNYFGVGFFDDPRQIRGACSQSIQTCFHIIWPSSWLVISVGLVVAVFLLIFGFSVAFSILAGIMLASHFLIYGSADSKDEKIAAANEPGLDIQISNLKLLVITLSGSVGIFIIGSILSLNELFFVSFLYFILGSCVAGLMHHEKYEGMLSYSKVFQRKVGLIFALWLICFLLASLFPEFASVPFLLVFAIYFIGYKLFKGEKEDTSSETASGGLEASPDNQLNTENLKKVEDSTSIPKPKVKPILANLPEQSKAKVLKIKVAKNEMVTVGQKLLIAKQGDEIITINSDKSGLVKGINVAAGDIFSKNDTLVWITVNG